MQHFRTLMRSIIEKLETKAPSSTTDLTVDQVVAQVKLKTPKQGLHRVKSKLKLVYAGRPISEVERDLEAALPFKSKSQPLSAEAEAVLKRLGLLESHAKGQPGTAVEQDSKVPGNSITDGQEGGSHSTASAIGVPSDTSESQLQSAPPGSDAVPSETNPDMKSTSTNSETATIARPLEAESIIVETPKNLVDLKPQALMEARHIMVETPQNLPDKKPQAAGKAQNGGKVKVRRSPRASKLNGQPVLKFRPKKAGVSAAEKKTDQIAVMKGDHIRTASGEQYPLTPLRMETSKVPKLSHDLSRVLFNPGVYQLQDPRSRVWNFDPYLGSLMPVSEFNYDALNKYTTSSEDVHLREVALKNNKRYIGSTSSMSGVLSHFHYLISAFRTLNLTNLSKGFVDNGANITRLQRGPAAIFLRYKDGVYAVDADKEYDSANVLMSLGRSMEKLLTSDKGAFEKYRKRQGAANDAELKVSEPEAYHYSELGQFLLRSQLDAHDSRLPGTGMFDLKTRAVAAVRMMIHDHEKGVGYQIKERFGTWESYEREYYDMMRSAFLKYSLQVRMGRMDGIFVAYHNTERLFGFQYVPITEMDLALHGQVDRRLGDHEFSLSIQVLDDIFNEATTQYPSQSLRFHFEARPATEVTPQHMYIFAEPVTEDEIVAIQSSKQDEIRAFEERIFNPQRKHDDIENLLDEAEGLESLGDSEQGTSRSTTSTNTSSHSNAADVGFLDSILGMDLGEALAPNSKQGLDKPSGKEAIPGEADENSSGQESTASPGPAPASGPAKPFTAWKLNIRNVVNGLHVVRPQNLKGDDIWTMQYSLNPLSAAEAHRHYRLCKNRRKAALEAPQDTDDAANFYLRRLVSISRSGAQWRRHLDELDANREQVVLYGQMVDQ